MPRKTYVHRTTFEILREVDDHRDASFARSEWSRNPQGLETLEQEKVPTRYWIFDPPGGDILREMSPDEKTATDSDPQLVDAARAKRRDELFGEVVRFIESRYSTHVRAALLELQMTRTAPLLDPYFTWHRSVWVEYKRAVGDIDGLPNVPAIEGVAINFDPLVEEDPRLAIEEVV